LDGGEETVETVGVHFGRAPTSLKRGVNEMGETKGFHPWSERRKTSATLKVVASGEISGLALGAWSLELSISGLATVLV
jgi:hypothetical protein